MPREVVFSTLHTMTTLCSKGSSIVFDYWDTDAFAPDKAAKRVTLMQEMLRRAGEPMKTGLDPSALAQELQSIGLHVHEQFSPDEIQKLYFLGRTDDYYAYEHAYFVRAVVE